MNVKLRLLTAAVRHVACERRQCPQPGISVPRASLMNEGRVSGCGYEPRHVRNVGGNVVLRRTKDVRVRAADRDRRSTGVVTRRRLTTSQRCHAMICASGRSISPARQRSSWAAIHCTRLSAHVPGRSPVPHKPASTTSSRRRGPTSSAPGPVMR